MARSISDRPSTVRPAAALGGIPRLRRPEIWLGLVAALSLAACGYDSVVPPAAPSPRGSGPVAAAPSPAVFFPTQEATDGPTAHMDALLVGTLALEDGCLRAGAVGSGETDLVVWPNGFALRRDGQDIRVLDADGREVGRIGEEVLLGGGQITQIEAGEGYEQLRRRMSDGCSGPYWIVGEVVDPAVVGEESTPAPRQRPVECPPDLDCEDALLQDAMYYAADRGISPHEAVRRFRLEQTLGDLGARLEERERDTFAGFWIQHEPEYRYVAAFTRDGEETIRPYIAGKPYADVVEVRRAAATYAELLAAQEELIRLMRRHGLRASSGTNVQANRVEVYVFDPASFRAKLRDAGAVLPEHVVLIRSGEEGSDGGASVPGATDGRDR